LRLSDSLQRHIARHGESFKPSPSGRSKRACAACHASKTKCDGNETCSRCTKKGIECVYEKQYPGPQAGPMSDAQGLGQDRRHPDHPSLPEQTEILNGEMYRPLPPDQNASPRRIIPRVSLRPVVEPSNGQSQDRIEWILATRIERDTPASQPVSRIIDDNPYPLPDALAKQYTELYLTHFHHRWPIIHSPTYVTIDHYVPQPTSLILTLELLVLTMMVQIL
jgi:Fungal Zn(2)-Cys(6) binuclear cluster domain